VPFHQGLTRAQGDPGFFDILGKIAGTILPSIPGPIGAIAGSVLRPRSPQVPARRFPEPVRVPGIRALGERLIPGGRTGFECPDGGTCPKGYRLNKSSYTLQDGTFVAKGSRCVRIRRTNPTNVRALRRAIRREEGFIRLARKTGLVTVPKARRVRKAAGKR